jgi:hypothetical protein
MPSLHLRREGFTRTQTVFAAIVFLLFAAVVIAEVSSYLTLHGTAHALESAKTLDTLLAQYATENDGAYPTGEGTHAPGKSVGIALDLLQTQFTPNADIFAVGSTTRYAGTDKDYADLVPENMSWDFTAGANTTTGIKTDEPDSLPVLYTTSEMVDYRPGQNVTLSGHGPFGSRGMIVALKSGAVEYRVGASSVFVPADFKGTGTYTQIKP